MIRITTVDDLRRYVAGALERIESAAERNAQTIEMLRRQGVRMIIKPSTLSWFGAYLEALIDREGNHKMASHGIGSGRGAIDAALVTYPAFGQLRRLVRDYFTPHGSLPFGSRIAPDPMDRELFGVDVETDDRDPQTPPITLPSITLPPTRLRKRARRPIAPVIATRPARSARRTSPAKARKNAERKRL